MAFDIREFTGGEAPYLVAGHSTLVQNSEDDAKFIECEPDRHRLPDHS
jgi:hypothetical protein